MSAVNVPCKLASLFHLDVFLELRFLEYWATSELFPAVSVFSAVTFLLFCVVELRGLVFTDQIRSSTHHRWKL